MARTPRGAAGVPRRRRRRPRILRCLDGQL